MDSPPDVADDLRDWRDLPLELTESILRRLGAVDILTSAQKVCSTWRRLWKEPSMWCSVDMSSTGNQWMSYERFTLLGCEAVDRSCGQLVDINIAFNGTNELLKNIANRSSKLKRLGLLSCNKISDRGLIESAAKLPLLEDLDISYCSFSRDALAVVGSYCPLLKTLKISGHELQPYNKYNKEAFAILQNMPELRHLQLIANDLTDNGLQAILDGCPHLESLDIRRCFNITLAGNLGKRCAERIKDFRRPLDSTDDYEYRSLIIDIN